MEYTCHYIITYSLRHADRTRAGCKILVKLYHVYHNLRTLRKRYNMACKKVQARCPKKIYVQHGVRKRYIKFSETGSINAPKRYGAARCLQTVQHGFQKRYNTAVVILTDSCRRESPRPRPPARYCSYCATFSLPRLPSSMGRT